MINQKLLQTLQEKWVDIDIEELRQEWLPDDVINHILEAEISLLTWKEEDWIDLDKLLTNKRSLFANKFQHA